MVTFSALDRTIFNGEINSTDLSKSVSSTHCGIYRDLEKFKDEHQSSIDTKFTASPCKSCWSKASADAGTHACSKGTGPREWIFPTACV